MGQIIPISKIRFFSVKSTIEGHAQATFYFYACDSQLSRGIGEPMFLPESISYDAQVRSDWTRVDIPGARIISMGRAAVWPRSLLLGLWGEKDNNKQTNLH